MHASKDKKMPPWYEYERLTSTIILPTFLGTIPIGLLIAVVNCVYYGRADVDAELDRIAEITALVWLFLVGGLVLLCQLAYCKTWKITH